MLSRLIKSKALPLAISTIYGSCAVLAVVNLGINGSTYSALDLGLTIAGIVPWVGAATHSLCRRIYACRKKILADKLAAEENKDAEAIEPRPPMFRASTHAAVNASLHMTAASFFVSGDAIYLSGLVPNPVGGPSTAILAARTTGSGFWLFSASIYLLMAVVHDRQKENRPDDNIKLFGMPVEFSNLAGELLYLSAGGLFAFAIYASETLNPIRAASNTLWLTANSLGTLLAIYDIATRTTAEEHAQQPPGLVEERSLATLIGARPTGP